MPTQQPSGLARSGECGYGEGRIRTSEAARATDLQSAAFDRFATSPRTCSLPLSCPFPGPGALSVSSPTPDPGPVSVAGLCPHADASRSRDARAGPPVGTTPRTEPITTFSCQDLRRSRNVPAESARKPLSVLDVCGAGEGIRTPDRLITNQLLYRTELRQPRQKSICSTWRATHASGGSELAPDRSRAALETAEPWLLLAPEPAYFTALWPGVAAPPRTAPRRSPPRRSGSRRSPPSESSRDGRSARA
jgi:hypothetical protein